MRLNKTVKELLENTTKTELDYWLEYLYISTDSKIRKDLKFDYDEEYRKEQEQKEIENLKQSFSGRIKRVERKEHIKDEQANWLRSKN